MTTLDSNAVARVVEAVRNNLLAHYKSLPDDWHDFIIEQASALTNALTLPPVGLSGDDPFEVVFGRAMHAFLENDLDTVNACRAEILRRHPPTSPEVTEEIAREAAKVQPSGTRRIGAPHKETCTCRQCTDLRISQELTLGKIANDITLGQVRECVNVMLGSAQVFTDGEGVVTHYKVKTGALHKLIGVFADSDRPILVPVNLPEAALNAGAKHER